MPTLTVNPYTETLPDFRSVVYTFAREAVMHGREGMTHEQAAEILIEKWNANLERRKATWEAEREEREAERQNQRGKISREPHGRAADDDLIGLRPSRQLSPDDEDDGLIIAYPPARFAINKLRECEYIELSYFTPEGRVEAAKTESMFSNGTDIFTFSREDNVLLLKPLTHPCSQTKVIQDEDLTWDQLCLASTNFLEHIIQEKWPKNMVDAMHTFFFRLTNHKMRNEGADGLKVLILPDSSER